MGKEISSFVDPNRVYSLDGFFLSTGLGLTTKRLAERGGFRLPTFQVGRRKFVRGSDAIAWMEKVSEHQQAEKNPATA